MVGDLVMIDAETGEDIKDLPGDPTWPGKGEAMKIWERLEAEQK